LLNFFFVHALAFETKIQKTVFVLYSDDFCFFKQILTKLNKYGVIFLSLKN
jgi:hypothetical protein